MQFARHGVVNLIGTLLGRRSSWRLGRSLYMEARADAPNDISTNGELVAQSAILSAIAAVPEVTVFDIGANLGNWALPLLERAGEQNLTGLELHTFEPVPATFQELSRRIHSHPLSTQVHLVQAAVSDTERHTRMNVYRQFGGRNSLDLNPLAPVLDQVGVEATTVDAYCRKRGIDQVHLVKCDTEGHDMQVLLGARSLFSAGKILACQFEYNHLWVFSRHFLKDVFDFIGGCPYSVAKVTPRGFEVYSEWHPELERFFEGNWLLLHHSILNPLAAAARVF